MPSTDSPTASVPGPRPDLSVVIPVLDEEPSIPHLLARLRPVLEGLGRTWEILLVDDGSTDGTWAAVRAASRDEPRIQGISLSRNFGHQNALFAGLHYARGRAVVTMDGDLQHPPEVIPALVAAWAEGYRVVETVRRDSEDASGFKVLTARAFHRVFAALSGLPPRPGITDFRLVDDRVAAEMRRMGDARLFLRGYVGWMGWRRTVVPFDAAVRQAGSPKYDLPRMSRFSLDAIVSFSSVPLRLGIWLGLLMSGLAFLELVYILVRYFQGATVPGWASILGVMVLMFGILFLMIGLLGAYVSSIFEMLKRRPRFLVEETCGFPDAPRTDR